MKFLPPLTCLEDLLGKEVVNIWRTSYITGEYLQRGIVVSINEDDLPLVGVDCQGDIRKLPIQDLGIVGVYPEYRVVDLNG